MFEVDANARIDVLVDDAVSGERRRRTTYSGTIWIGGRVDAGASIQMSRSGGVDEMVILPDSLAYDPAKLADAVVTATFGLATPGTRDSSPVLGLRSAGFVPDPQGRPPMWVHLHVVGRGGLPCGVSYRVETYTVPDPVLPGP